MSTKRRYLEITDDMIECIRYKHAMRPTGELHIRRSKELPYGTEVVLRCGFCDSRRFDIYNTWGELDTQNYDLSPAYKEALRLARGGRPMARTDVTLEIMRRLRSTQPARTNGSAKRGKAGGNVVPMRRRAV